ncbi:MAG: SUMF1/EgtB/PvdO family nonheme iron enzyme [Myxococcales bacterium]|nr:SUMF1/EgtB/PvdO family nonheme iron enzyme [Myxococcales bacterium]
MDAATFVPSERGDDPTHTIDVAPLTESVESPELAFTAPSKRYLDQGRIAKGGMGDVRRVYDHRLSRSVAMKVMRWEMLENPRARARFITEGRMTASLQHPSIVPVHDRGEMPDGRPWFTMKLVEGRTLAQAIADGMPMRRLIDAFGRICDAIAYAHSRGVIHRDLKPHNMMVGAFGEVLVMDWGLARHLDQADDPIRGTWPTDESSLMTRVGEVLGTPAYMAPEQAAGRQDEVDRRSDVYGLGAILYEILARRPPYEGPARMVWAALRAGGPAALPTDAPEALRNLCEQAMAREPARRYADAGVLAEAIRRWLDGELRRAQARAIVEQAKGLIPLSEAYHREARRLRSEAAAALDAVASHASVEAKRPGWALEDAAERARRNARLNDVQFRQLLHSALELAPDLAAARGLLNAHYRAQLLDAEAERDADAAAEYEALLRNHDPTGNATWLRGDGRLTLVTDPPDAQVRLFRFVSVDRRLEPQFVRTLPNTPIVAMPLAMGSYLLLIEAPGRATVRYPVHIRRGEHWLGAVDGLQTPVPIQLPEAHALGPGDCYVPAGWFDSGGDADAIDALPRARVYLDGFIIRRDPVTNAEYCAFLNAMLEGGHDIAGLVPAELAGSDFPTLAPGPDGWFHVEASDPSIEASLWPVISLTQAAAQAYCAWYARQTRKPWTLPTDQQWEKAARGVDGRHFPWGDHFDPIWTNVMGSTPHAPMPCAVDRFPLDVSPYGMRGAAGNVRDHCINTYQRDGGRNPQGTASSTSSDIYVVKGGSFTSVQRFCACAGRFGMRQDLSSPSVGFRLARSLV